MNGSSVFKWTKEYLITVLSSGKNPILSDPIVINAFNQVDRADFVPQNFKDKAYNDLEIDIGFNEKLTRPTLIAQTIALLQPKLNGKYLDIGSGTGYSAAILGFIVGDSGKVYSIERVQWLWEMSRTNIQKYPNLARNTQFIFKDGIDGLVNQAPFDGIIISFALDQVPEPLLMQLKMDGGRLVVPMTNNFLKVITRKGKDDYEEENIPGFTFGSYKAGMA